MWLRKQPKFIQVFQDTWEQSLRSTSWVCWVPCCFFCMFVGLYYIILCQSQQCDQNLVLYGWIWRCKGFFSAYKDIHVGFLGSKISTTADKKHSMKSLSAHPRSQHQKQIPVGDIDLWRDILSVEVMGTSIGNNTTCIKNDEQPNSFILILSNSNSNFFLSYFIAYTKLVWN